MHQFQPGSLLAAVARSPRPHLTFYSADGTERVELSGRVLANWVAKTANFLDEEGLDAGDVVRITLPVHWRGLVWAWAAWVHGSAICTRGARDGAAMLVTHEPGSGAAPGDAVVVAVPLQPLALRWQGELPGGVVDGGAEVMGQADALLRAPAVAEDALAVAGPNLTFADLAAAIGMGEPARIAFAPRSLWEMVRRCMAAWAAGGSVVLFAPEVPAARWAELAAQEGATLRD